MLRPELKLAAEKRPRPLATALSLHYMDRERDFVNTLEGLLPRGVTVMSYEHDGVVIMGAKDPLELLQSLQPRLNMQVAIKSAPPDMVAFMKTEAPSHLWVKSTLRFSTKELIENWQVCHEALKKP